MSNKEELDIENNIKGFSTPMPRYEFQKMEIHDKPAGFSDKMLAQKSESYPIPPPPKLPPKDAVAYC